MNRLDKEVAENIVETKEIIEVKKEDILLNDFINELNHEDILLIINNYIFQYNHKSKFGYKNYTWDEQIQDKKLIEKLGEYLIQYETSIRKDYSNLIEILLENYKEYYTTKEIKEYIKNYEYFESDRLIIETQEIFKKYIGDICINDIENLEEYDNNENHIYLVRLAIELAIELLARVLMEDYITSKYDDLYSMLNDLKERYEYYEIDIKKPSKD